MIEGICRVCGSPLADPITHCPACETPHHQDCWEYNRGCSIFGCSPAIRIEARPEPESTALVIADPVVVDARLQWRKTAAACLAAGFVGLWATAGLAWAAQVLLPAFAVAFVMDQRREEDEENARLNGGNDPNVARDLERKAISALVGAKVPEQLAQAYALFEQRHPRDSLPAPQMKKLALELADHGYHALGIEAAEKALRLPGLKGDPELTQRRRNAFLRDPAYLVDALTPAVANEQVLTFKDDPVINQLSALPEGDGAFYLLSLLPQGWSQAQRAQVLLPGHHQGPRSILGHRVAGPYPRDRAATELQARWQVDQPCLAVPASLVTMPPHVEELHEIHLSQKEARFKSAGGELVVDWRNVRNVIYGRFERVTVQKEITATAAQGQGTPLSTTIKEHVDSRPLIEIHVGSSPHRLRIDTPRQDLFNYLGRRRELSHAANMALTAKDLSRFGPGARVSHGLHHLLSERLGHGMRFQEMDHFEEYTFWFWMLGTDHVRARWTKIQEELMKR